MSVTDCPTCGEEMVQVWPYASKYECPNCSIDKTIHNNRCQNWCGDYAEDGKLYCAECSNKVAADRERQAKYPNRGNVEFHGTKEAQEPLTSDSTRCPECGNSGSLATTYNTDLYKCRACRLEYWAEHPLCQHPSCADWAHDDLDYCTYHAPHHGIRISGSQPEEET